VHGRQELVLVTEVVLAELPGRVALRLERRGGKPTLVSPVRYGFWPVMNAARPAVQLCSP
jgi:hypothetical protein